MRHHDQSLSHGASPVGKGCARVQPVMHIALLLGELGAKPQQVFAEAGISGDLFNDPGNTISFEAFGRLVECSVAATDCAPTVPSS